MGVKQKVVYAVAASKEEAEYLIDCGWDSIKEAEEHLLECRRPPTDPFYGNNLKVYPVKVPQ